jgi:glucokinase
LALLVDILNPEKIILGSIYSRCRPYLEPAMRQVLEKEALGRSLGVCEIVPSELDEAIGHYSALCVAPYRAGLWQDL